MAMARTVGYSLHARINLFLLWIKVMFSWKIEKISISILPPFLKLCLNRNFCFAIGFYGDKYQISGEWVHFKEKHLCHFHVYHSRGLLLTIFIYELSSFATATSHRGTNRKP